MAKSSNRIIKAALLALAAGALVAVDNPVRPIDHDVAAALANVAQLTAGVAHVTHSNILAPVVHHV